eukprot:199781_1
MCKPQAPPDSVHTKINQDEKLETNDNDDATTSNAKTPPTAVYSFTEPSDKSLRVKDHFSSLLFGGSVANTVLELVLLAAPFLAIHFGGEALNVKGSMPLKEVAVFFLVSSIVRRFYNAYLEA